MGSNHKPDGGSQARGANQIERGLRVVLSGSFKRELEWLKADFKAFERLNCKILSPQSLEFIGQKDGFAYTQDELDKTPNDIERSHIAAILDANFLWLHSPGGYLGASAALEVGFALAAGIPVFGREAPSDIALGGFVRTTASPEAVIAELARENRPPPTGAIAALQAYYRRAAVERGYDSESPRDSLLLLVEEVGELARAVRGIVGLKRHEPQGSSVSDELADVLLYLVHISNVVGVSLDEAVKEKERKNVERHRSGRKVGESGNR